MFRYFLDPLYFAHLRRDRVPCHFCQATTVSRLDGGHFYGRESIDAICFTCLRDGRSIELNISTNDIEFGQIEAAITNDKERERMINELIHCTPPLPTWQDTCWPFVDGDFCTFIKIASKQDFESQHAFIDSLYDEYVEINDPDELWSFLPDRKIGNLSDGQYNVSVYLFRRGDRLVTTWDAS
jgi:uncharacterized protein CbrC (UPF0167 family)